VVYEDNMTVDNDTIWLLISAMCFAGMTYTCLQAYRIMIGNKW